MKKALLGLCNNVVGNLDKIKIWSKSFKRHSNGDVVLLCANANESELQLCKELGIIPVQVEVKDTWYINNERLKHTAEFLKTSDFDAFVVTDVFDVIFQGDPFSKLELARYDLFVSGEGVKVNQEPWNADNISKIFPQHRIECGEQEVINSGIIAGKRKQLIELFERMYKLCEVGLNTHNVKDQAALIVLVARREIRDLKIFNLDDGWAMHCAVAGPTQFFEGWGFKNNIKYGIPSLENNFVVDKIHTKYDMVHQYNRVPIWKECLEKSYRE